MPLATTPLAVPNWRVHTSLPAASYFRTNASSSPVAVWPGREPPVTPATYTPDGPTAIAFALSNLSLPNWRVHSSFPAASYFRTKASEVGAGFDGPGNP